MLVDQNVYLELFYYTSSSIQSNLGYPNADYPKLLGYSKTMDSPYFFLYYLLQLKYQLFEFRLSEKFYFSK